MGTDLNSRVKIDTLKARDLWWRYSNSNSLKLNWTTHQSRHVMVQKLLISLYTQHKVVSQHYSHDGGFVRPVFIWFLCCCCCCVALFNTGLPKCCTCMDLTGQTNTKTHPQPNAFKLAADWNPALSGPVCFCFLWLFSCLYTLLIGVFMIATQLIKRLTSVTLRPALLCGSHQNSSSFYFITCVNSVEMNT